MEAMFGLMLERNSREARQVGHVAMNRRMGCEVARGHR